ncbi:MAG: LysR family transcriptional regulator [Ruminococcus sp.]|nr:LysR family transcriptional regulator [Ruminococcus sp.]
MYNPQLETFIKVADCGSFNKASEELYISSPAVIKQINLLESSLNLRLFVRTHRGLIMTDAGKSLYHDAKYIIGYCNESVNRARNAMQKDEAVIRIGTSPMTPGQFLMDMWASIHEICPDIKFQLIPFDNTPQNSVEILKNLGKNIDIVAGLFDDNFLKERKCSGLLLSYEPIRCAVSIYNELANKSELDVTDLYGRNLMIIHRGWNKCLDVMRDDLLRNHSEINIVDFNMFTLNAFNQCENSDNIMIAIDNWANVHPLLKVLPVDWNYCIPFGLLHSPEPSPDVRRFLRAVRQIKPAPECKPKS